MRVKCYNYNRTLTMLGIKDYEGIDMFVELLKSHDVEIFTPPKTPGSGRAKKKPEFYMRSNEWLDDYMKGKNLFALIQGKSEVKVGYRDYEKSL